MADEKNVTLEQFKGFMTKADERLDKLEVGKEQGFARQYHYSDGGVGLRGDRGDRRGRNRGILSLLLRHRGGGRDRKAPGGRDDQPRKPGCGDGVRPVPDQRDDRGEDQAARYEGTDGGHYGGILAAQREGVIHGIRTSECSRRCRDGRRRGEAGRSGGQGSG